MGNCPCWPKKRNNYDPYVDEDYMEYDSPAGTRYKPPQPTSTNTQSNSTQRQSQYSSSRPPDDTTYNPPNPPPTSQNTQRQDSSRSSTHTEPPPHTTQQPQYYSESVYLSRNPNPSQPTDSMLLDSMMKSSILNPPHNPHTGYSFTSEGGSSLVESHPDMRGTTTNYGESQYLGESNMGASLATSTSSSMYYDAPGGSYMITSVNEGAFEPSPSMHQKPNY